MKPSAYSSRLVWLWPVEAADVLLLCSTAGSHAMCCHALLQALQANDKPRYDHGIEVLYRFANFDPFQRSKYFG